MKKLLVGIAVVVVVAVVGLAIVLLRVDVEQFRPQIESSLSQTLGRPVQVGKMALSLQRLAFTADDIRIGDDPAFAKEPFITADRLAVQVALWPLLTQRELQVKQLLLQQPSIHLIQSRKGRWNVESLGDALTASAAAPPSSAAPQSVRIDALRVEGGRLTLRFDDGSERQLTDLSLAANGLAADRAFAVKIEANSPNGAKARIDGTIGPLAAGNMLLTPFSARLDLDGFDLTSGMPGGGLAGALDYRGDLATRDGAITLTGKATVNRLRLYPDAAVAPAAVTFDHQATYDLKSRRGELGRGAFAIGASALAIGGRFDNRKAQMTLDLGIEGNALPVDDIQGLLPMLGMVLPEDSRLEGGTLKLSLHAQGKLDALTIAGPMRLEHSRLKGFSLGSKVSGVMALAGLRIPDDTVIESAAADVTLDAGGVTMRNIVAVITDLGRVTGEGSVNAQTQLDFRLRIQPDAALASGSSVAGGSVASALQGAIGKSNRDGIGLTVGGTAQQPQFKADTRALAGAVLSGLVAGKTGDPNAADATLDKAALKEKAADAVIKSLFGKKKKAEPEPEPTTEGKP